MPADNWCPSCPGDVWYGHFAGCPVRKAHVRRVVTNTLLLVAMIALFLLALFWPVRAQAGGCYRPFTYAKPTYAYQSYYNTYVPYVVEVQVIRDRYYSLSDLYRDRMYLELYDQFQKRFNSEAPYIPPAATTQGNQPPRTTPAPPLAPQPTPQSKAGSDKAEAILVKNCQGCHTGGKGAAKLDMTDLTKLTSVQRWAVFGMSAAGDMPPPPAELRAQGKEQELNEWKKTHALKEEEMQVLYPWAQALQAKK